MPFVSAATWVLFHLEIGKRFKNQIKIRGKNLHTTFHDSRMPLPASRASLRGVSGCLRWKVEEAIRGWSHHANSMALATSWLDANIFSASLSLSLSLFLFFLFHQKAKNKNKNHLFFYLYLRDTFFYDYLEEPEVGKFPFNTHLPETWWKEKEREVTGNRRWMVRWMKKRRRRRNRTMFFPFKQFLKQRRNWLFSYLSTFSVP